MKFYGFIKRNYATVIIIMAVLISMVGIVYSNYIRTKTNNELFNAYVDSRTLINKQIDYIYELTRYIGNVNDKLEGE